MGSNSTPPTAALVLDMTSTNTHRNYPKARHAVHAGLLLLIAWLVLIIVAAASSKSLEFDGAMNLLTSRSIAQGDGPREVYDSGDLFPAGVQSKEPYVLVGALVFKLFGVGPLQTQLPNLIYLSLLCATLLMALRRMFDPTTALTGCILLLAMPSITQYGLRGYGELPTLFFGLAALSVVAWPGSWRHHLARRCLMAGALAGLALATKVVGVVLMTVVGIVLLCRLVAESRSCVRDYFVAPASFALGVVAPLLLVELWRWYWIGASGYGAWWSFQLSSILSQSGAAPHQPQAILSAKIAHHFQILSTQLGLSRFVTMAAIIMPLAALAFAFFGAFDREQQRRSKWFLLGLLLLVMFYFPWWLAFVPTEKAWLRYIYIGLIALAIIAAVSVVTNLRGTLTGRNPLARLVHLALAAIVVGTYAPMMVAALKTPISFAYDGETTRTREAARLVSGLPAEATILAYGWYSAPSVQIYTHRPFMDLTDWPIGRLVGNGKPAYVVADRPTLITGMLDRLLARYPHRALMPSNPYAQVYAMDFSNPVNPFLLVDQAQPASRVAFADGDYPFTTGMEPYDPIGGRFIESDSEILLRYEGQRSFQLVGYMDAAQPSHYRWPGSLEGRVVLGTCPPLPFRFDTPGWRDFTMPLACKPPAGQNVRVRVLLDNAFDWPMLKDRQRALLLSAIGFIDQ